MQLTISDAPPALHLSYNRLSRSIEAHFSKPASRNLTRMEEKTMLLIKEALEAKMQDFVHLAVDRGLLAEIKHVCAAIINAAYQQTGVKFELDTRYLVC